MKKNLILATVLILCALSCKKNHDAPPESKGYLMGKVDGVFFNDLFAQIIIHATGGLSAPPPAPSIEGRYDAGRITLDFATYPSKGERILGNNGDKITIYRASGGVFFAGLTSPFSSQGSGKINILEATNINLKGTFECIAPADSAAGIFAPISITEGEFNIDY